MATDPFVHIRRTAGRETYQDGLTEIVAGALLFVVALATGRPAFYWMYLAVLFLLGPGLKRLKARYTYPRIGLAELPGEDPTRLKRGVLSWVLGVFLLVAGVLTFTGQLTDNLAWRRLAPAIGGVLFAGGFWYLARQSGLARHYALTGTSAALGLLLVWPEMTEPYGNLRVWALLMALIALGVGAHALRRFVRDTPVAEEQEPNEG